MSSSQSIAIISGTARVARHLIVQALGKGHRVRAVVRSTARFYEDNEKQAGLTVHEIDFADVEALRPVLEGVDVVYVALGTKGGRAAVEPSWLNHTAVVAISTVLRERVAPGGHSATRVVLLSTGTARPDRPRVAVAEAIMGHQFNDLRAAGQYLHTQAAWLPFAIVTAGMLVDTEPSTVTGVDLRPSGDDPNATSYARVAAAMQLVADDPAWEGRYVLPVPTTPVPVGTYPLRNIRAILGAHLWYSWIPALVRLTPIILLSAGIGHLYGVRKGGA